MRNISCCLCLLTTSYTLATTERHPEEMFNFICHLLFKCITGANKALGQATRAGFLGHLPCSPTKHGR
jgi:hypothetical protein